MASSVNFDEVKPNISHLVRELLSDVGEIGGLDGEQESFAMITFERNFSFRFSPRLPAKQVGILVRRATFHSNGIAILDLPTGFANAIEGRGQRF